MIANLTEILWEEMKLPNNPPDGSETKPAKKFRFKLLAGVLVAILFEIGGYLLLREDQAAFGSAMFIAVPLVMGLAIALFTETKKANHLEHCRDAGSGNWVFDLVNWEGWICCVLASPILVVVAVAGALIGHDLRLWLLRKNIKGISKFLMLGLAVIFLVGAKGVEKPYLHPRMEIFNSSVIVPVTPERAWDLIKSMEKVETHKPLLLAMGLPIPQACTLDKEAVGGKRVCYFDQGIITQEITEWNPPHFMKTKITGSTLPGRHWLTFVNASYEFVPQGDQTLVTRTTTISSRLYPRWYWRQFEEYGVGRNTNMSCLIWCVAQSLNQTNSRPLARRWRNALNLCCMSVPRRAPRVASRNAVA